MWTTNTLETWLKASCAHSSQSLISLHTNCIDSHQIQNTSRQNQACQEEQTSLSFAATDDQGHVDSGILCQWSKASNFITFDNNESSVREGSDVIVDSSMEPPAMTPTMSHIKQAVVQDYKKTSTMKNNVNLLRHSSSLLFPPSSGGIDTDTVLCINDANDFPITLRQQHEYAENLSRKPTIEMCRKHLRQDVQRMKQQRCIGEQSSSPIISNFQIHHLYECIDNFTMFYISHLLKEVKYGVQPKGSEIMKIELSNLQSAVIKASSSSGKEFLYTKIIEGIINHVQVCFTGQSLSQKDIALSVESLLDTGVLITSKTIPLMAKLEKLFDACSILKTTQIANWPIDGDTPFNHLQPLPVPVIEIFPTSPLKSRQKTMSAFNERLSKDTSCTLQDRILTKKLSYDMKEYVATRVMSWITQESFLNSKCPLFKNVHTIVRNEKHSHGRATLRKSESNFSDIRLEQVQDNIPAGLGSNETVGSPAVFKQNSLKRQRPSFVGRRSHFPVHKLTLELLLSCGFDQRDIARSAAKNEDISRKNCLSTNSGLESIERKTDQVSVDSIEMLKDQIAILSKSRRILGRAQEHALDMEPNNSLYRSVVMKLYEEFEFYQQDLLNLVTKLSVQQTHDQPNGTR